MIEAALSWLDRGFPVFPIVPRGKKPLGSLVPHGLKDATRDPAVIRDWWLRVPKANIGLRTGEGYFVIDLDGPDAAAWFAKHCAPRTLTVKTAKGFHAYFSAAARVPNSAGKLAPGVDVRGGGGYVVAAPSIHPSGAVYTIARDLPIVEAPQRLIDLALPDERPVQAPGPMPAWRCDDHKLRAIPRHSQDQRALHARRLLRVHPGVQTDRRRKP
jgi:hypothetical protein